MRLVVLGLLLAPSGRCVAQDPAAAAAQQPAVAYAVDGMLYLATESGRIVQKISTLLPIGDFAISPDLKTVVFASAGPGITGGPFFILDVPSGAIDPMMPDPYFNDDSVAGDLAEFYTDPEFSPDGKWVVFATHAYGDGNEVQLSGPLAFLDLETREVSILGSTVGSDGLPLGYMRNPHWSPDGKQILGNIEGHAFVADVEGKALSEILIPDNELIRSADSYGMYGIGWLGAGCVLYQAGETPERDPARMFRTSTQATSPAAAMLGLTEDQLRGLRGLSGRLRMFFDPEGYRVEGPGGTWLIHGDREITFARLLPALDEPTSIPEQCR
jgi:WD40-like Beta Propeller Repeat